MHQCQTSLIALATLAASTFASVTTTVDLVDPSDGVTQPPPGIIAIDVIIDVTPEDTWTAGGILALVTPHGDAAGVRIRYAPENEPNAPLNVRLINPGTADRFVTFLTRPRNRDTDGRFTNAGAAIAGRYMGGPNAIAYPLELNVAWFTSPPASPGSPSVDGAVARLALDVSTLLDSNPGIVFVAGEIAAAEGPIILASDGSGWGVHGTVSASYDDHRITGLDWAVWYIPEPASLITLLSAAAFLRRRH